MSEYLKENRKWNDFVKKNISSDDGKEFFTRIIDNEIKKIIDHFNYFNWNIMPPTNKEFWISKLRNECINNPIFFFREFVFRIDDSGKKDYINLTNVNAPILYNAINEQDIAINSSRCTGRWYICKLIILYNFLFHNKIPMIISRNKEDVNYILKFIDKLNNDNLCMISPYYRYFPDLFYMEYYERLSHDELDKSYVYITEYNYTVGGIDRLENLFDSHIKSSEGTNKFSLFLAESCGITDFNHKFFTEKSKDYSDDTSYDYHTVFGELVSIFKPLEKLPEFRSELERYKMILSEDVYRREVLLK